MFCLLLIAAFKKRGKVYSFLLIVLFFFGSAFYILTDSKIARSGTKISLCSNERHRCSLRNPIMLWDLDRPIVIFPRRTKLFESPTEIRWRNTRSPSYAVRILRSNKTIINKTVTEPFLKLETPLEPGRYLVSVQTEKGHSLEEIILGGTGFEVVPNEETRALLQEITDPVERATLARDEGYHQAAIDALENVKTPEIYSLLAFLYYEMYRPDKTIEFVNLALSEGIFFREERQRLEIMRNWAISSMCTTTECQSP